MPISHLYFLGLGRGSTGSIGTKGSGMMGSMGLGPGITGSIGGLGTGVMPPVN